MRKRQGNRAMTWIPSTPQDAANILEADITGRQRAEDAPRESEPGKGSVFHICLPVAERPTVEPSPLPAADAAGGAETVLLVEDEEDVRRFVAAILRDHGYRVVETGDPEQALCACAAQPVDLLVTDVVMPRMSGVELARRARLTLPGLRTLYISGYSEDTHEGMGESLAGANFLQKPFSPRELAKKAREALEGR